MDDKKRAEVLKALGRQHVIDSALGGTTVGGLIGGLAGGWKGALLGGLGGGTAYGLAGKARADAAKKFLAAKLKEQKKSGKSL